MNPHLKNHLCVIYYAFRCNYQLRAVRLKDMSTHKKKKLYKVADHICIVCKVGMKRISAKIQPTNSVFPSRCRYKNWLYRITSLWKKWGNIEDQHPFHPTWNWTHLLTNDAIDSLQHGKLTANVLFSHYTLKC